MSLPAGAAEPAVVACETADAYTFDVVGVNRRYDKESYRQALRSELTSWMAEVGFAPPAGAAVELWLAVPEVNPAATQARAVVTWAGGGLVAFLSLEPETWKVTNRSVGVLGGTDAYPQSFGHRAGALLVKAADGADGEALARFLAGHGAAEPDPIGGGWASYAVAPLGENAAMSAIEGDPRGKGLVAKVEGDAMLEWIADRGRAFVFQLEGP